MIVVSNKKPSQFSGDLLVYFVRQPEKKSAPACGDGLIQERIDKAWKIGDCTGKKEECLLVYPEQVIDGVQAKRLLVVGLGKDELDRELFRRAGGVVAGKALSVKAERVFVVVPEELDFPVSDMAECLSEGIILGSYRFKKYQKKDKDEKDVKLKRVSLFASKGNSAAVRKVVKLAIAAAQLIGRHCIDVGISANGHKTRGFYNPMFCF